MKCTIIFEVPTTIVDRGTNQEVDASYDKVAMEASAASRAAETAIRESGYAVVSVDVDVK